LIPIKLPDNIAIPTNSRLFFVSKYLYTNKNINIKTISDSAKGGFKLVDIGWFTQNADSPDKEPFLKYSTIQPKLPKKYTKIRLRAVTDFFENKILVKLHTPKPIKTPKNTG
jgi:hypothetical protein